MRTMQGRLLVGGVGFALLMVACSSQCSQRTSGRITCTQASAPHHAYVVVQHMSGATIQRCVGFSGDSIDGQTLMDLSGVEYKAESLTSGQAVCQVDLEPAQYSQCFPLNQPYWALFVALNGRWTHAPDGFSDLRLHDREAIGWHYVTANDPSPAPPPMPTFS